MDAAGEPCNHVVSSQKVRKMSLKACSSVQETGLPARVNDSLPEICLLQILLP